MLSSRTPSILLGLLVAVGCGPAQEGARVVRVTDSLTLVPGAVNGAIIERDGKRLVVYGDPRPDPARADTVLLTHHRRDAVWHARRLKEAGAETIGPRGEEHLFSGAEAFWSDFATTRFHDYGQPTTKVLTQALPLSRTVEGGETIQWEDLSVRVVDTPGYTAGSLTYLIEIDGKKIAFTGDLIYGNGQIFDWYSLQDAIPELGINGYHGYGARGALLIQSLQRIRAENPDLIIPLRGPVIGNVGEAIGTLIERLKRAVTNYLSTSGYRWHLGPDRTEKLTRWLLDPSSGGLRPPHVPWMPLGEIMEPELPEWIVPIRNSRLILSRDGSGFLVDAGVRGIVGELQRLENTGRLKSLEGCFLTHYHDDHTHRVKEIVQQWGCPVYATEELSDVLEHPDDYRLPCQTEHAVENLKAMKHGQKLRWKEFEFTFFYFPGQTIFHDALLVRADTEESFLFVGDSFTPTGMDDYCPQNRNFLHQGMGFSRCLDMLGNIGHSGWLINQHVGPAFRFSEQQLETMSQTLADRISILAELFPWDDPNYGLDEGWARFYPYSQTASADESVRLTLKIFNHSPEAHAARVRLNLPSGWTVIEKEVELSIAPRREGTMEFRIRLPENVAPGIFLATADIHFGPWDLKRWTEAMIHVKE